MVVSAMLTGEIDDYLIEANENTVSPEALQALHPPYKRTVMDVRRFYIDVKKMSKAYMNLNRK